MAAAIFSVARAQADNLTWTGAVNNSWNTTSANWSGDDTVYADGDTVLFSGTSGEITGIVSRSPASTTVTSNNKVTFATGIMGATKPIGGPSILTGALVKNGTGELELGDPLLGQQFGTDSNKYSNKFSSVTVNAGTLRIRSRAALGTGTVTLAGGSKFIQASEEGRYNTNNEQIDNNFVLSGGLVEFPLAFGDANKGSWFRNGTVSGPGGIKVTGSSRTLSLSGNNTYQGGTTIDTTGDAGLLIASYTALGTGPFTANQSQRTGTGGGGLIVGTDLPGNTTYPNGVTNDFVINAGKFLNVYCTNATTSLRLSGDISGGGTLNKWNNASTLILSGNNTYSGGTVIAAGKIICESENSLGGGLLTIASGARLQLDFVGSSDVTSLSLGGSPMANGTWGSSSSPADHKNDTYFSGFGIVTVGPPKSPTTTAITQTAGTNPTDIGLSVTFTATVSGGSPSGTVAFYDGLTQLGTGTLNGSFQTSVSTTALPEGARKVVAQYQGDATYASSTSVPLAIQVVDSRAATTTTVTLTSGTNPSASGAAVTYTAAVAGSSPTGTVQFYDRENLIDASALNGSSQASITTNALPNGVRRITAKYSGDLANKPGSGSYTQHVNPPAGNGKLKVFILAGQSNMQGHGRTEYGRNPENLTGPLIVGGIGSLRGATTRDPLKYGYFLDPNTLVNGVPGFIKRNDVYISYWDTVGSSTAVKRAGYLDAMFGVSFSTTDGRIGPEYAFGHVVGSGLGDKVLLIKTAWGGKSLKVDFRPPSSGGTVGPFYLDMVDKVHRVLNNLLTYYPDYDGGGYELSGFGWHQGWNDRVDASAVAEYEFNLTNLIKDIRAEFNVPALPFVIANTGMASAPWGPGSLIEAQGNVSNPAGKIITVDTRPFDYGVFQSPIDQGYHWNGNGESYFQIGEAMGGAMLELLSVTPQSAFQQWAANPAQGLTAGVNDGPLMDPDFDGIPNLLEFVLSTGPKTPSTAAVPTLKQDAGQWVFEYDRNDRLAVPGHHAGRAIRQRSSRMDGRHDPRHQFRCRHCHPGHPGRPCPRRHSHPRRESVRAAQGHAMKAVTGTGCPMRSPRDNSIRCVRRSGWQFQGSPRQSCNAQDASTRIVAGNVALELLDGVALGIHHPADQVADRDQSDETAVIDDGQVADAVAGHELHAFFNAVPAAHGDRRTGNDVADLGVAGSAPLKDHLAAVVALGEDSDNLVTIDGHEGADIPLSHASNGFVNRVVQLGGPDFADLVVEDIVNSSVNFHGLLLLKFCDAEWLKSKRQELRRQNFKSLISCLRIALRGLIRGVKGYLDLMRDVMANGERRSDRTGTGTISVFGRQARYDLREGFPCVTTKKLHLRSIIHELLWFLRGETNTRYLKENGVTIWDEWEDAEGELGPVYGKQWRAWPTPEGRTIDQIHLLIDGLLGNPHSRRHIVSAWNVGQIHQMALPPCHLLFQFYVHERARWRAARTFLPALPAQRGSVSRECRSTSRPTPC